MQKVIKIASILLVTFFILLYATNFNLINYGFRQLVGQIKVITQTTDVDKLMADSTFPDSLKAKIELIREIKKFTVDSLGLKPSESYGHYYDQQGKPIVWVVTACLPYSLQPKKWKFPVAGEFSYKGFFDEKLAHKEANVLKKEGFDVRVGAISAWSTLGYLKDPILSSMLEKKPGQLASLLIHELTHGTLFVKNDLKFNENLADFVGDEGAKIFLRTKFGYQSKEFTEYMDWKQLNESFAKQMVVGVDSLNKLFESFTAQMSSKHKDSLKYNLIGRIMRNAEKLPNNDKFYYGGMGTINNAYFTGYLTYRGEQEWFKTQFKTKFNGNFKKYLAYLKNKYNSLGR